MICTELDLYLVLMSDGVRATSTSTQLGKFFRDVLCEPKRAFREYLSSSAVTTILELELSESVAKLRSKAATLEVQLADTVRPTRLPKQDAYLFLRQLLNPAAHKAKQPLKYDTHLDFLASDSLVRCEDDHLVLDQRCVRVLTMKEPPERHVSHRSSRPVECGARRVHRLSGVVLGFRLDRMRTDPPDAAAALLQQASLDGELRLPGDAGPTRCSWTTSASATVRQLGDALTELEVHGHFFGECSLLAGALQRGRAGARPVGRRGHQGVGQP